MTGGDTAATPVQVVWFKRDLRLHDHAPLCAAAERGPVLPLYVVEPDLWRQHDASFRHWRFIRDSLIDLDAALRPLGGGLIVMRGGILEVLADLERIHGRYALWSHEETGNDWTFQRDRGVAAWCRERGIIWTESPSNGVVRRLGSRDGWAARRDAVMRAPQRPLPGTIRFVAAAAAAPSAAAAVTASASWTDQVPSQASVQRGGRREGLGVLASFLESRSDRYMRTISKPGVSARHCSRLSAHIAYGTLSVREIDQAAAARVDALFGDGREDWARQLSAFRSRLAWRCHFVQKLEQQPSIESRCMHPAFEGMREADHRDDLFTAWCEGRTGYPLVDACMRSLHANGWINFRMRAMLVAFASYHLWLDWRRTAPVLARLFTDYEPGIHYSQFQMQSGVTGINAVRIYNPVKQSLEHDPEGRFIRRYLPELRDLPTEALHQPWDAAAPPADYPPRIVDHEQAAREARRRMTPYWRGEGFREGSQEVLRKLGSRDRRREGARGVKDARGARCASGGKPPQLDLDLDLGPGM
ncbi:MAG: FAD-binding domain-containing protein [Gammaproteobacteria bacterium]